MVKKIAVVLKGYPRLSETFIAQEILSLERAGLNLTLVALRHPTDGKRHPVHDEIKAPVRYLPEYLHEEPWRVIKAWIRSQASPRYWQTLPVFLGDLWRDPTLHRVRRFGQALVLTRELEPGIEWLHAHFIHTPASVAEYTSMMTGLGWSCSAHAKDIWTSPDGELRRKLGSAAFVVTCTKAGYRRLVDIAPVPGKIDLSYHGLDLMRFSPPTKTRPPRDGSEPSQPVVILSVGRAVAKKGYEILLMALARLPNTLAWRLVHIGGGDGLPVLKARAGELGLSRHISWMGSQAQEEVLAQYRAADLFALACRVADDGDRDGLPDVLVEAASQGLACVSTTVSGVTELLEDGTTGLVVGPDDPAALAQAIERAIRDPSLRARLGAAAEDLVRRRFDHRSSVGELIDLFAQVDAGTAR